MQSRRRPRLSQVGRQIAVAALGAVVAFCAVAGWVSVTAYLEERSARRAEVQARAEQAAAVLDAFLRAEIQTLQAVAAAPRVVAGDRTSMYQYFQRADPEGAAAGGGFAWVDTEGRLQVLVAQPLDAPPADLSGRAYVQRTLATQRPVVDDAVVSGGVVPIVTVTAPTFGPTGDLTGLVLRTQRLDARSPLLRALEGFDDLHLVDGQGQLIVDEGPIAAGPPPTVPAGVLPAERVPAIRSTGVDGGARVAASAPLAVVDWTVVLDPAAAAVFGPGNRQLATQLAALALTAAGALAALLVLARRSHRHAELNQELGEANARAEALRQLAAALSASLTPADVARVAVDEIRRATEADHVVFAVRSPEGAGLDRLVGVGDGGGSVGPPPMTEPSPLAEAVRREAALFVGDPAEHAEPDPPAGPERGLPGMPAWAAVPLLVDDTCIGGLELGWTRPRQLDEADRQFLLTVADLAARGVQRARAYEDEHDVAAALQRAAMPSASPAVEGFEVAGTYQPASRGRLGGDWFDALRLPKGGVFFAVGDVVGHGLTAAEDMAQLRNAARALAVQGHDPARLLTELDQFAAVATVGQFATIAVVVVDPGEGTVAYAAAGHVPPMVRRADGTVEVLAGATGPPLAVTDRAHYPLGAARVEPGDVLVLYSDGLVEDPSRSIDDGLRRLEDALVAWRPGDLPGLCAEVIRACRAGCATDRDDLCVLAARPLDHADELGDGVSSALGV